jgi:hypothetical protein|uniref:hypothetical protein n=1 Tax=Candidatus Planktophila sp. TaxID=2175601 RepID=UPI004049C7D4
MKMRLLVFAVLLPLVLAAPVSSAAVKAGSACTKQGVKQISGGKSFTCVKQGKKLVWKKGVAVKKPAAPVVALPTPSPIPSATSEAVTEKVSFKPWSTSASAREISDAAQANFKLWVNEQSKQNSTHKTILHPDTPAKRASNFSKVDQLGSQLFTQYFNGPSATVIGASEKWVVDQLNNAGENYGSCANNSGNGGLNYCLNKGRTQGYVVTSDDNFNASNPGRDGSALLAHEYFHLVQRQMSGLAMLQSIKHGEKESANLFPAWLEEGAANFVGFTVAAVALDATYWEGRPAMFTYIKPDPSNNRNSLQDYEIRNGPGNDSPTYPYIAGQVASEFIVASVGFQKFLNIWLFFKETKDFEKSFERAIGMSKDEFYGLFEKARENLGLPPVSWKLDCLTNRPLSEYPANPAPCKWS